MSHLAFCDLPVELLADIARLLRFHDRAQLSITCTHLNKIVEPLIWTNIEFHSSEYHASSYELNDPPPYIPVSGREYQEIPDVHKYGGEMAQKAQCFVNLLQDYYATDQIRLQQLCSHVKNLCTGVDPIWGRFDEKKVHFWHILPFFHNLKTLELHGDNTYDASTWTDNLIEEIEAPHLRNLLFAKFFGYIPPQVVRWTLRSGQTLERLELGLLDRPVSTSLQYQPVFPPPQEGKVNVDPDDDDGSDYGSLYHENVIPRPLGGILSHEMVLNLPKLKILYLCSPADSPTDHWFQEYSFSSRAETASLSDWKRLLLAANQTLETIVFEHRPGAEYIENDGMGSTEYLRLNKDGRINKALINMFESLLDDERSFPQLKSVYLYGFAVGENSDKQPTDKAHGGRLMLDLKDRGVRCEARRGQWCFFDNGPGYVFWCNWQDSDGPGSDDSPEERWDALLAEV